MCQATRSKEQSDKIFAEFKKSIPMSISEVENDKYKSNLLKKGK